MKRKLVAAALCACVVGLGACTNPDGTRDNRLTGATLGALGGAAVGNAVRGDSRGTLGGAVIGGAAGALVGNAQDRQQAEMARQPVYGGQVYTQPGPRTW